ncbi:MAG: ArsR/SmtB family transcription factor [Planctomycetota bacterium]
MARPFSIARAREAAPLFAALGDPTRLALVALLSNGGPTSIGALAAHVDVSRQAVAKHLELLADVGLVRGSRSGREHIWELKPKRLATGQGYLARIDAQWDAAVERLNFFLDEE